MSPRPERRSRVDVDDQPVLVLFLHLLPRRNDKDIVNVKLVEILFPVIHPVHILCLGFFDGTFAHIQIRAHLFQFLSYIHQDTSLILLFPKIKGQVCLAVILRQIRQDVHKHLLLILLCQRHLVLNLDALNP